MINVLLLRTPEKHPDKYEAAFRAHNYLPVSVPVLETALVNLEHLVQKVASGPQAQGISGVIITSKRAVEAWGKAVESVISGDLDAVADDGVTWGSVPFYVVGEATASAAAELRTRLPSRFVSYDIRGGSQSGTAQELAHFILNDLPAGRDESPPRALLYLTGDKNRDTLPNILTSQDIVLHTLQVYATQGSSSFPRDLETALERVSADPSRAWGWVVFFAPSAAEHVMPTLHERFHFRSTVSSSASTGKQLIRIAVIGPTTASFFHDELKLQVDVVASKPTADGLVNAIVTFDSA